MGLWIDGLMGRRKLSTLKLLLAWSTAGKDLTKYVVIVFVEVETACWSVFEIEVGNWRHRSVV